MILLNFFIKENKNTRGSILNNSASKKGCAPSLKIALSQPIK